MEEDNYENPNQDLNRVQNLYHHEGREDNHRMYCVFVEFFTDRKISFVQDLPPAFAGLSRILEHRFRSSLCHGMPQTALDFVILWHHDDSSNRRTLDIDGVDHRIYPRWTWMGWTGRFVHRISYPYENNLPRMVWDPDTPSQIARSRRTDVLANSNRDSSAGNRWVRLVDTFPEGWRP